MARLTRPLVAVVLFALASFARADAPRLLAPAAGTTLRGGSLAELRWSAAQLPPAAEEWEAFLSIDGGKYYAFRVTPHLDVELRRFTFAVPNVDTGNARILIRTGNEVHEMHFETAGTFSIRRDPNAEQPPPRLLQLGRGEEAREGDPAVLSWTDGARDGSEVRQQASAAIPVPAMGGIAAEASHAWPLLPPAASRVGVPSIHGTRQAAQRTRAAIAVFLPSSLDLLLVCRRRNI